MLIHQVEPQLKSLRIRTKLQGVQILDKALEVQLRSLQLEQTECNPIHIVELLIVEVVTSRHCLLLLKYRFTSYQLHMTGFVLFAKSTVQTIIILVNKGRSKVNISTAIYVVTSDVNLAEALEVR